MVSYDSDQRLEDHGNRFVCILFNLAKGITDRSFDSDKVYSKLGVAGFDDQQQARAELVQFLRQQNPQRVTYNGSNNTVSLTIEGLQWAKQECDRPPYLDYRYLRNSSG
jgi:hypothetical protein